VEYQSNGIVNQLFGLAMGPSTSVKCYNGYYVNDFKFHTQSYGRFKKTMNSGVCVKESCYDDNERDYYGMLKEVVRLKYLGSKCKFFCLNVIGMIQNEGLECIVRMVWLKSSIHLDYMEMKILC